MSQKMYKQIIDCRICKNRVMTSVWKMHVMGKKHMHYTPKKITVIGTFDSNRVDEVHEYFGNFGTIGSKKVSVQDGKVSIDYCFQDRRAHSKIIYKEHRLFGQVLKITWEQVTTPLPFPGPPQKALTNVKRVQSAPNQDTRKKDDASVRVRPAKKTDAESSKRAILDTLRLAQTFSNQVSVLQNNVQGDKNDREQKKKLIYDDLDSALSPMFALKTIYFFGSSVTGLEMQGSDLDVYIANVREDNKPEVATLKLIRFLIFKCRKFCDVLLISGAKIPIIKCIHTKTQICCDLNIKNKLSVCNSQLIRYYLSLDDKLRSLMIIIKFWADCYDLKKVNFFSSYSLYMMVIFYLQHEPYKLPSVRDLQKDIAPDLVEGWNCAFNLERYASSVLKEESLKKLVADFFKFYSDFDYTSDVISPYFGSAISKICFLKPYDLPEGFEAYSNTANKKQELLMNAGICIQDPFEHSRNVSASVPLQCVGKFVAVCKSSFHLMQGGEKDLLYKILTQEVVNEFSFSIDKFGDQDDSEWIQSVKDITKKILTDVLELKVVEARSDPLCYNCSGNQNVWDNRINIFKNLLAQLPPHTNEIDREIAATKCIIKYFPQNLPLNFSVYINFKQNRVYYMMKQFTKKNKIFFHIGSFFRVKIRKYLTGNLKSENEMKKGSSPVEINLPPDTFGAVESISNDMTQSEEAISEENKTDPDSSGKQVHDLQVKEETLNEEFLDALQAHKSDEDKLLDEDDDEEEEDVPADFFDDFSNQDFMDGLDIVDAWDEEKMGDVGLDSEKSPEEDKKLHSPIRYMNSKSPERRVRKHRSKSLTRRYSHSSSHTNRHSRSRSREKVRTDRRDPEKTKRDIHKDKIKCAKDREQKIVNDKLKIVETGLVPPGTEMEVDLSAILKEKGRHRSTTESSAEKSREIKADKERDRDRRYLRRSVSRERKPLRRSPVSSAYRTRPREPAYFPKRKRSTDSNISDRELWIRSSRKRSRSRSKSRGSKFRKYEEAKKKKSFLEEIRDKLNETRPAVAPAPATYGMVSYSSPIPHPIQAPTPAPVPAPAQYFSPTSVNSPMQQYDQSFFIGDAYQSQNIINQAQNLGFNVMTNTGNVMQMQVSQMQGAPQVPIQVPPAPLIKPKAPFLPLANVLSDVSKGDKREVSKETIEDVDKLFADKKISLSDFLAITAKCEVQSSSPEHLQKKVKVISRCQDVIRGMSDDRKFSGRLTVKPTPEQKNKMEVKYQSPLRRIPIVRFQFTSPAKVSGDLDSFAYALDKILQKVGVLKEVIDLNEPTETFVKTGNSSFADEETAVLTMKASLLNSKKVEVKGECEECKKRKAKTYVEVGTQCADNKETVNISTQVTEEEFSSSKGLPKNDSIAYLTPAQLLGKNKEKETSGSTVEVEKREPLLPSPIKKNKPKPPTFKTRGGFRKTLQDRTVSNFYDYDYDEGFDFYERGREQTFEGPRESFGNRYGGGPRFQRQQQQFMDEEGAPPMMGLHQFREDEGNFTDFSQPYRGRGRGGRLPPRY